MRVTFAGTPLFAARALDAIVGAGHQVPLVLTQPDRPAGRHQRSAPSAVSLLAATLGLPVYQPERLKTAEQQAPLLNVTCDVMVVAAYGLILPTAVLAHPRHGCLNIHASLLPRWRGAAPIQRAILAGDRQTGVCIMQMDVGLDTGPVVSSHTLDIAPGETAGTLHDKLADAGSRAIVAALARLERDGRLPAQTQAEAGATYAAKVEKSEAQIDWSRSAVELDRQVRAFNPAPGASTTVEGAILKIWHARLLEDRSSHPGGGIPATSAPGAAPGALAAVDGVVIVRCGDRRWLALEEVQPASGRRMHATDYLKGRTSRGLTRLGT